MRCEFEPFRLNSNKIANESANLKFEFFEQRKDSLKLIGELDISLLGEFDEDFSTANQGKSQFTETT